jgi:hypothetical protein
VARSSFQLSAGALVLVRHGLSVRGVAFALGESPQRLSRELRLEAAPNPAIIPVVRALAGIDAASEMAEVLHLDEVSA